MPVTEQDALRAMRAFKELSGQPELQAKAKLIHDTYRSEQEAAGKPLFEGFKREQAQQQLKVRKLFQDREKHGLPDDARASIDETFRENPDEKYALFNRKFFETSGIPKEQVDSLGDALIKDYSKRTWGEEVADNKAFSERLGADFDTEDSARKMAQVSAMNGVDMFEGLAKLEEENANNPNFKARSNTGRIFTARTLSKRNPNSPRIGRLLTRQRTLYAKQRGLALARKWTEFQSGRIRPVMRKSRTTFFQSPILIGGLLSRL